MHDWVPPHAAARRPRGALASRPEERRRRRTGCMEAYEAVGDAGGGLGPALREGRKGIDRLRFIELGQLVCVLRTTEPGVLG